MKNKFVIIFASLILTGCMVKNYEKTPPPSDNRDKTTIKWSDGSKTDLKAPTIENRSH